MSDFRDTTLTILSGATESETLDFGGPMRGPVGIHIVAPATLPETVNPMTAKAGAGAVFGILQSGGTDITLAAGKATQITFLTGRQLKLKATGATAADRVFEISANRFSPLSGGG